MTVVAVAAMVLGAGGAARAFDGPPPEAIEACKVLADGATCSVKLGDRTMAGTCRRGPDGRGLLACAPNDRPPHPLGPPREAVEACQGSSAGAACSFSLDGSSISGTCQTGPGGSGALACAPKDRPPHGRGPHGPPPEALTACKSLSEGATCSVQLPDRTVPGTCRRGPDGQGPLACAPPMREPPAEAFAACQGKADGAACTMTIDGRSVSASCHGGPGGTGPLACLPPPPDAPAR
jgi:hypothetical protein